MKKEKKTIIPPKFFSTSRKIITSKKALKDVIPIDWDEVLKTRKNNKNQIVKIKQQKSN